jgi:hydrogenase nickel incorporation protein HypA/HybF
LSTHYQEISCHESVNLFRMHELSLALETIRIADLESGRRNLKAISEIEIEIGYLSGVEVDAFEAALALISGESVLKNSLITIRKTPGKGRCISCDKEFEMYNRLATCPDCKAFPSEIKGGSEFRILSLVIE